MVSRKRIVVSAVAGLFCLMAGVAQADGLADLKGALSRLQAQAPVKGVVELKAWRKTGDGKEAEESNGQASIVVEDSPRGLQVLYGKDVLSKVESEERARAKDPNLKAPTIYAMSELDTSALRPMVSAAAGLARQVEEATFKGEKADAYAGKPARVLSFEMPIEKLSERNRKYVKKFESVLDIWIAADGTPLASRHNLNVSGRAFVVVSFEQKSDDECVYSQVGDRLVTVRKTSKNSSSGAGEKQESKVTRTLQVQS